MGYKGFLLAVIAALLLSGCQQPSQTNLNATLNTSRQVPPDGKLSPCPESPNCVSSIDTGKPSYIRPIRFSGDPLAAMAKIERIIDDLSRAEVVFREGGYLRAEFTSRIFRFIDDVEVMLNRAEGILDIRSSSRVGNSDFGVNRRRVELIRKLFSQS